MTKTSATADSAASSGGTGRSSQRSQYLWTASSWQYWRYEGVDLEVQLERPRRYLPPSQMGVGKMVEKWGSWWRMVSPTPRLQEYMLLLLPDLLEKKYKALRAIFHKQPWCQGTQGQVCCGLPWARLSICGEQIGKGYGICSLSHLSSCHVKERRTSCSSQPVIDLVPRVHSTCHTLEFRKQRFYILTTQLHSASIWEFKGAGRLRRTLGVGGRQNFNARLSHFQGRIGVVVH